MKDEATDIATGTMKKAMTWARKGSLRPMTFRLTGYAKRDDRRYVAVLRHGPLWSRGVSGLLGAVGLMIVAGTVCRRIATVTKKIYDQVPEPKYVIAMGSCVTSGNIHDCHAAEASQARV